MTPKEDADVLQIARKFWADAFEQQRKHKRRRIDVGLPRNSSKVSRGEIGWVRARRKAAAALDANASTPTETTDLPEGEETQATHGVLANGKVMKRSAQALSDVLQLYAEINPDI